METAKKIQEMIRNAPAPEDRDIILFKQITDEMLDLYKRKNADYGGSITDTYNRYGDVSFRTRIRDKLNRWDSLSEKKSQVTDEKIRDTLMDLANYSILAIIEMEREK